MKINFNKLKVINIFIRFFILGAVFLLPLVFDAFSFLDNIFNYPKIFILYVFISGLFVVTLIKVFYIKKIVINKSVFKHILWPSIYILVLIVSTFLSSNVNKAFFGSYTRQFGLLTHLFLYLWFVLLLFHFSLKTKIVRINEVYKTIAFSAFLVSVYAVLQYLGIDFVYWKEAAIHTKRAFSTLGQPNYLGLYIVMVIPIFFYLFKVEKNKYLRYFWLTGGLFSFLAWFFTGSRSAWLGLIFTGLIFIVIVLIKSKSLIKSKAFIISIISLVFIITALFSNSYFQDRFSSSLDFSKGSVAIRLLYWEAAYDKIIERPVIGYGPEQQKHVLRDAYSKEWIVHEKLNSYSDRAHNIILDYLLMGGILFLFAYFMILRSWSIQAFKSLKANNYQIAILILPLCAYLVTLLFSFEIIVTTLYFWLFGALIIVGSKKKDLVNDNYWIIDLKLSKYIERLLIFSLLILLSFFIYLQLQKIIANHYFLTSKIASSNGVYNEALLLYNYSQNTGYSDNEYDLYFADSISFLLIEKNQKPYKELQLKLKDIESRLDNYTYENFFVKARINSAIGEYDKAKEYYKKAISLAPGIIKTYPALAVNYFFQENFDMALKYYDFAINKMPNISDERLNNEHREQIKKQLSIIWEKKGDIYFKQDKYDKAISAFKKAYNYNLYQIPILKKIADSYYLKGDINTAIWYNEKGKQRNPDDPVWSTALAWLYYQQGDKEESKNQLQEALFIRPNYDSALDLKKQFNFNF